MEFTSEGLTLSGHLALPERHPAGGSPGFVLCHGFPTAAIGAAKAGLSFHTLADRIADQQGAAVLAMNYRGCGASEGHFSIAGWLRDVEAGIDALTALDEVSSISLIGFGTGGALAICAGAQRREVRSVAAFSPPADFADWSDDPEHLLGHSRAIGVISDDDFPRDFDAWASELAEVRAIESAAELAPRSLSIVHGADDDVVPVFDSRMVADAHGKADLRIIQGAGHLLRYDPRAIAVLLGWVDRQRYSAKPSRRGDSARQRLVASSAGPVSKWNGFGSIRVDAVLGDRLSITTCWSEILHLRRRVTRARRPRRSGRRPRRTCAETSRVSLRPKSVGSERQEPTG